MLEQIGVGAIITAWVGSIELRLRGLVGGNRFNDFKEQYVRDIGRVEGKLDALLLKNGLNPKEHDK